MQWLDPILPTRGQRVDAGMHVSLAWRVQGARKSGPRAALCIGRKVLDRLGWTNPQHVGLRPSADGSAILLLPVPSSAQGWGLNFKDNIATLTLPLAWVKSDVQKAEHVTFDVAGDTMMLILPEWARKEAAVVGGQVEASEPAVEAPRDEPASSALEASPTPPIEAEVVEAPEASPQPKWSPERKALLRDRWLAGDLNDALCLQLNALPGPYIEKATLSGYAGVVLKLNAADRGSAKVAAPPEAPPEPEPLPVAAPLAVQPTLTRMEKDKIEARNLFDGGWGGREIAEELGLPLGTVSNWVSEWRSEKRRAAP